jgi:hypothetical protein
MPSIEAPAAAAAGAARDFGSGAPEEAFCMIMRPQLVWP